MNIQETYETLLRDYSRKVAEVTDGAAYAFVVTQLQNLKDMGEDPTQYEVIFVQDNLPQKTEDGLRITQSLRLRKVPQT